MFIALVHFLHVSIRFESILNHIQQKLVSQDSHILYTYCIYSFINNIYVYTLYHKDM